MLTIHRFVRLLPAVAVLLFTPDARAQSFRVQCPTHTALHPLVNSAGVVTGTPADTFPNPHIKCQQLSGGDGFATMGDGTQTYLFAFGPLSGLSNIVNGLPGTVTPAEFNVSNLDSSGVISAVKIGAPDGAAYTFNGAIGLVPDVEGSGSGAALQAIVLNSSVDSIFVTAPGSFYPVNPTVTIAPPPCTINGTTCVQASATAAPTATGGISSVTVTNPGNGYTSPPPVTVLGPPVLNGHVDAGLIMDVGVLNGNIPAPLIAIDEGDELFLTLTNVGQVMRPDLFEQHTVHFHGYANASAFYDGVPDASVAINIGGSFTYYYLAPEAGTYMWHCHISPPEHLQMGMVGQIYVRPRQNSANGVLRAALQAANVASAGRGAGNGGVTCSDILCTGQTPLPAVDTGATAGARKYAYNDGDGSTAYDVEYPIQMHGFDPNFHFVGMTFNPESFADNKDKYFLLNGRSYPDTINPNPLSTQASDGTPHFSQPLPSLVSIPAGGKALLRLTDLNVTEYHTLASLGIPMHVIAVNARLLRDLDGNNMYYDTNSITLAGGESVDVILDASDTTKYPPGSVFYLYTPQLDHLSNDAENFGGMMTEVRVN
jgi:FtsP/CotA-like multicopper oxidase with cupredoxin domain